MNIKIENTAINTGISKATKIIYNTYSTGSKILDYGYGKGRNSKLLKNKFYLDGLETNKQIKNTKNVHDFFKNIYSTEDKINKKYDAILLTYILNVIPSKKERMTILNNAYNLLNLKGKIYIQVRGEKSISKIKNKKEYLDGYLVGKGNVKTFQKGYNEDDLKKLFKNVNIFNFKIKKQGTNYLIIISKDNFGQMSLKKISANSDYLQLDICGLSIKEAINRYINYKKDIPLILHGDWSKKSASEDNLEWRYKDYIKIINRLKEKTEVLGITIHPPKKKKYNVEKVINIFNKIKKETDVDVFLENRSNNRFLISKPKDVVKYSQKNLMTIDIPQLYIACNFDENIFYKTLSEINWKNVSEVHLGGLVVKRKSEGFKKNMTLVAQKIDKGVLDYSKIKGYIKNVPFKTFEILGSDKTFENQIKTYKNIP